MPEYAQIKMVLNMLGFSIYQIQYIVQGHCTRYFELIETEAYTRVTQGSKYATKWLIMSE